MEIEQLSTNYICSLEKINYMILKSCKYNFAIVSLIFFLLKITKFCKIVKNVTNNVWEIRKLKKNRNNKSNKCKKGEYIYIEKIK